VVDHLSGLLGHARITTTPAELAKQGLALNITGKTVTWTVPALGPPGTPSSTATASFQATVGATTPNGAKLTTAAAPMGSTCAGKGCATALTVIRPATPKPAVSAAPLADPCTQPTASPSFLVPNVTTGQGFEIDGNLCTNTAGHLDWDSPQLQPQPVVQDGYNDCTQFTSGSESSWPNWGLNGCGRTPSSADIGNVYAFSQVVANQVYAYLGVQRQTSTGSVAYWVELNQQPNTLGPIPNRTVGDLRLAIQQQGNGPLTLQFAATWTGTSWGRTLCSTAATCSAAGFFAATNNFNGVTDLSGAPVPSGTFFEAALNLTTLFPSTGCSGNYGYLNLRSSSSNPETSNLGDYIAPRNVGVPSTCASIRVNKNWNIGGTIYPNGSQPPGFTAGQLSLTPAPQVPGGGPPQFGQTFDTQANGSPYLAGSNLNIAEGAATVPANCTNVPGGDIGSHTLAPGLNTYTVTNVVTCPTLTLQKSWVNPVASDTANLFINGRSGSLGTATAVAPAGGGTSPQTVTTLMFAGENLVLGETLPATNTGFYTSTIACTPPAGFTPGSGGLSGTLGVPSTPGNILCTVTNTRSASGHLILQKHWVNGATGDSTTISASGTLGSGTADAVVPVNNTGTTASDDTVVIPVTAGETVALAETVPGPTGTYTTTLVCDQGTLTPGSSALTGSVTVPSPQHGDITCTFTNARTSTTLTVFKDWVNGAANDQAGLSITGRGPDISTQPTSSATAIAPGGTATSPQTASATIFSGQTITVTETVPPAGQNNTGSYTSTLSCDNSTTGTTSGSFTVPSSPVPVTCRFTNTRIQSTLRLEKSWANGAAGDSTGLSIVGPSGLLGSATATVPTGGNGNSTQTTTATVFSGDPIDVNESVPGPTGTYTSTVSCTPPSVVFTPSENGQGGQVIVPPTQQTIVCTFTNTRVSSTITLNKAWVNPFAGDLANLFISNSTGTLGSATAVAPAASGSSPQTVGPITVFSGDMLTVGESLPTTNTGSYTSVLTCTPPGVLPASTGGVTGTVVVPSTPVSIACTVTNTRASTGVLTLVKDWVNGASGDSTVLTATGSGVIPGGSGSTTATVPTGGTGPSANTVTIPVASGENVALAESLPGPTGTYTNTLSCNEGTLTPGSSALTGTLTVPAPPHGNITCTFTNTRVSSTITLNKAWVNPFAGDVADLFITDSTGTLGSATAVAPAASGTSPQSVGPITVFSGDRLTVGESLPTTNTGSYTAVLTCTPPGVLVTRSGGVTGTVVVPTTEQTIACTVTNTRASTGVLTLVKDWVHGAAGDSTTLTATGSGVIPGGSGSTTATVPTGGTGPSADTVTIPVASGEDVALSESLPGPTGTYTNALACDEGTLTPGSTTLTGTLTVPAPPHGNITCTFTNTRVSSTITLEKAWVNPFGGDLANLFITNSTGTLGSNVAIAPATSGTSPQTVGPITVFTGDTLTIGETLPTSNTGGYTSTIACDPAAGFTPGAGGQTGTLVVPNEDTIACTVTNTRAATGELTLVKDWVNGPSGDSTTLTATGSGVIPGGSGSATATVPTGGTGASANTVTIPVASGENVALAESLPGPTGTYTTTLACDEGTLTPGSSTLTGTLTVPAPPHGNITCTFTNTRVSSTITLNKAWVNPFAGDLANLFITNSTGTLGSATAVAPAASGTSPQTVGPITVYSGDRLTVGETLPATNIGAYTSTIACVPPDGFTSGAGGQTGTLVVPATPTGNIHCTVTNTRASTGKLTLEKAWENGVAGDSTTLTATGSGVVHGGSGSTIATVPNGGTGHSINMVVVAIASGETVHLAETKTASNTGTYTTTLACNAGTLNHTTGVLTVPAAPHGNITCTFTNVREAPSLSQGKTVDKQTAAVGDTLTYTVTVINHGPGNAVNVVARDTLPPNVTLVSADTGGLGTFDAATGTWTIPLLQAGRTAVLTITVTVLSSASGQTLINQLEVDGATTVNDPCPDNPARSCASTVIAALAAASGGAPSGSLPFTGMLLGHNILVVAALLVGGAALVLVSRRPRPRPRHRIHKTKKP
jgi:uncharacterized repeat protein (TIGR01451 family)